MKDIDEYAEWTGTVWLSPPDSQASKDHALFGLVEEVGEVIGLFKREVRGDGFDKQKLVKELGDAGYYWVRMCLAHGLMPSEVLTENVYKLESRKSRGVLKGSGDDR